MAEALSRIEKVWLRQRFDAIDAADYGGARDDADLAYTWDNFVDVRTFYERAAVIAPRLLESAAVFSVPCPGRLSRVGRRVVGVQALNPVAGLGSSSFGGVEVGVGRGERGPLVLGARVG